MNPRMFLTWFVLLSFFLAGCASQQSEVATNFGYKKSAKVEAGPYQLHYGQNGSEDLVLLAQGKSNLFSRSTGDGTDVYLDGLPFIHFQRRADGSVTNLSMVISDQDGKDKFTLIDKNADGQWDVKIDDVTGKAYIWKDGGWVQP